ncbi:MULTISPECIES: FixH family protein [unclassified Paenibacillus]|uniref:FixH family protein n=1 Tax=unclassified Paenibacillus TaxID=185978 RepID=UPI0009A891F3|nr:MULTISPECIES: FixH family protein [unclassified Paenibacillus]SLK20965.1 YtkA-like [Paenibacillus sp. RU5A]SOC76403.1 YtkA-like [Paenibacillus sp. RU26A]SOC77917.1 YtkA-like [Paenibacillus sp. RU5M]
MNIKINRMYKWMSPLLLVILLCACTAKVAETDESGLPPHISVNLQLPETLAVGSSNVFSVQVSKSNVPLEHAETAEFVIWPENNEDSAVTIKADESSPGSYSVSYVIEKEGLYVVRSRIQFADAQVMPTKRFAIGDQAIERLAQLESDQHTNVPAPAAGHH